jgi:hypothetical protein
MALAIASLPTEFKELSELLSHGFSSQIWVKSLSCQENFARQLRVAQLVMGQGDAILGTKPIECARWRPAHHHAPLPQSRDVRRGISAIQQNLGVAPLNPVIVGMVGGQLPVDVQRFVAAGRGAARISGRRPQFVQASCRYLYTMGLEQPGDVELQGSQFAAWPRV